MRSTDKRKAENLKANYGISLEDYNKMFRKQKGRCALCFRSPQLFKYELSVDHCHETNRIRGLLCQDCNRLLTHWRTLDYFKRVVNYLEIDSQT